MPDERDPIVMLKAEHIDVVAVGEIAADPWDDDALHPRRRVSQWADPEHLRYVKMVTEDGVLTGFVSVGMPRTAAELTLLFERRGELPADRSLLLRFDGPDYDPSADADAFAPADDGLLVQRGDRRSHRGVGRVRQHDRRVRRTGHPRRHRLRRMQGPDRRGARPRGRGRRDAEPHALTAAIRRRAGHAR